MSGAGEATKNTGDKCCEEFDPSLWDEKEIVWKDKPFLKESTWCFFYIPLNFSGAMTRANRKIEDVGAAVPSKEFVLFSDMISRWSTRIYLSVSKDTIPGANIVKLSGTYVTKVFEGPYKDFDKWIKDMQTYVKKEKGLDVEGCDMYAQYGTCPKCAKKYGKNFVVALAKI